MAARAQGDLEKLRRIPWFHANVVLTSMAVLCTVGTPLSLFSAELGLSEDRIGLLGGIMPLLQVAGLLSLPLIARFGARLVSTVVLSLRYAFLLLFLVAPLHADRPDTAFVFLLIAMAGFSLCRAVAEGAIVPWSQEFVPRSARGRTAGRNAMLYVPVALVVSWLIQMWLDGQVGLWRFYPVFLTGIVAGVIGALCFLGLHGGTAGGGGARTGAAPTGTRYGALAEPLSNRNFLVFLVASGLQYLLLLALGIFLVLFFRDLGISSGELVFLSAVSPAGAALGTWISGWLIDRYGTRPVFLVLVAGQAVLLLALPALSADAPALTALAALVFFLFGLFCHSALAVGGVYLLNVIPPASKEAYTTVHYITVGLIGGAATWGAGILLTWLGANPLSVAGMQPEPFTVLFVLAAVASILSGLCFHALREEDGLSVKAFFANFATGNPMRALVGIHRFGGETSEDRRRELAFVFGSFGSPLAKKELIEALYDPSFDVRHEAVRALGHMAPHDDVTDALRSVLALDGLVELQYAALESLGRIRARSCAPDVARFLDNANPLLRARAIRSLGEMRARETLPRLRALLTDDPDLDCRLAAVSALGKLRDRDSLAGLIAIYLELDTDRQGMGEPRSKVVLLAIAKIVGCEESFAHYWRHEQRLPGQAVADLMMRLARIVARRDGPLAEALVAAATQDPAHSGSAWQAVQALAPLAARARHGDAPGVALLMQDVAHVEDPHPALTILCLLALRRVLR